MALSRTLSRSSTSLLYWGAHSWKQYSRCGITSAEQRWRITSINFLAILCIVQPRLLLAFLSVRACCWLMFNLVFTRTPTSFSARLHCSCVAPNTCWCLGLFLPRYRTLHFLLNIMRCLSAHFSSLWRSIRMTVQPSRVSAAPSSFVSLENWLRLLSATSYRSPLVVCYNSS